MTPEAAEIVALKVLTWLAGHSDLGPAFMGASGVSAEDMAHGAKDPVFLASVLEFVTQDDRWVMEFCDLHDIPYDDPLRARFALPGAEQVHWT